METILIAAGIFHSEYAHAPERRGYETPLDSWDRIDVLYARQWEQLAGTPPKCEMCV